MFAGISLRPEVTPVRGILCTGTGLYHSVPGNTLTAVAVVVNYFCGRVLHFEVISI